MAQAFSNPTFFVSGTQTLEKVKESSRSSDYLQNKKAKLLYPKNFNLLSKTGSLGTNNNYLLYKRGNLIKDIETCDSLYNFNKNSISSGVYNTETLNNINVISNMSANPNCGTYVPVTVNYTSLYPIVNNSFYNIYMIDPCASLFGKTACGYNKYKSYRTFVKPPVINSTSLVNCNPVCLK